MYFDDTNNFFDIVTNENEFSIDKPKYYNTSFNIENINFNRDTTLYTPLEGFNKGNMFSNLYLKYKNHSYNLKVNNKKDELLYKIQMYNFALRDYNLYLDLYPNDKKVLDDFNKCNKILKGLKEQYEKEYSPLTINDVTNTSSWTWINNPWPWDKGGNA